MTEQERLKIIAQELMGNVGWSSKSYRPESSLPDYGYGDAIRPQPMTVGRFLQEGTPSSFIPRAANALGVVDTPQGYQSAERVGRAIEDFGGVAGGLAGRFAGRMNVDQNIARSLEQFAPRGAPAIDPKRTAEEMRQAAILGGDRLGEFMPRMPANLARSYGEIFPPANNQTGPINRAFETIPGGKP